jgi:hypothetical protein
MLPATKRTTWVQETHQNDILKSMHMQTKYIQGKYQV